VPASASPALAHVPVQSATRLPTGAPETGGGGAAGLQDGVLFLAGGAAILAGLASLAYRSRLARNGRRPSRPGRVLPPDTLPGYGAREKRAEAVRCTGTHRRRTST
jgi:hypothetical protein